jgi:hypothetical protein
MNIQYDFIRLRLIYFFDFTSGQQPAELVDDSAGDHTVKTHC